MTNKEIARTFYKLGKIMELHEENKFKIRSYQNAYLTLRKWSEPLADMEEEEILQIKGVGRAIAAKVRELVDTGNLSTLEKYREKTPQGVEEMLNINGFGPKKIRVVWKELGVESLGELWYACNENRLIELKGFGKKTQDDLLNKLEYYQKAQGKYHFATLEQMAKGLKAQFEKLLPGKQVEWTGALRRHAVVLEALEFLIGTDEDLQPVIRKIGLKAIEKIPKGLKGRTEEEIPVVIYQGKPETFGSQMVFHTGSEAFLEGFLRETNESDFTGMADEREAFAKAGIPYLVPALREDDFFLGVEMNDLVQEEAIKGVVHAHSTFSDGIHTVKEMAEYAQSSGYQYLGMTDHSQSAFYANGLKWDRVLQQFEEIDRLNEALAPFKIFKGIESDILSDGSLDYTDDQLAQFDFVIASVHSNLKMDEAKATDRLLKAIENPHTSILGHPTGRLLLSREGYPIDHYQIIEACARYGVAIELNANPYRLDLDWKWIPLVLEKGVKIAINPDAHSQSGIHDIHFGVLAAQKGGLKTADCLTCLDVNAFETWIHRKKEK